MQDKTILLFLTMSNSSYVSTGNSFRNNMNYKVLCCSYGVQLFFGVNTFTAATH